jgi:hypothetical protein
VRNVWQCSMVKVYGEWGILNEGGRSKAKRRKWNT